MEVSTSKELDKIGQKLQQGLAAHPDWYKGYLSKLKPGEEMPYHANMGITKAEYELLLKPAVMKLTQVGTIDVEFKTDKPGSVIIKTTPISPINGIIVGEKAAITPLGPTVHFSNINNTDPKSITGPWTGLQWSFSDFDNIDLQKVDLNKVKGKQVKLAVGKLTNKSEGILYYDVKDVDIPNNKKVVYSYIIYYPLNK